MEVTTNELKMHDKLLLDVIKRQAGTLQKAILEGVMNSVEAEATRIDITFYLKKNEDTDVGTCLSANKAFLSISDNGIGIDTEEQIIKHFETFGTPHEESERKTYAQFRMGRGQMFAFGHNVWKTASFKMDVDVNNRGLTYDLYRKQPYLRGCVIDIELYDNPIGSWSCPSIDSLKDRIKDQVKFIGVPVFFNDEQISYSPSHLQWDIEDENAYYLFNVGNELKIYNLGAYVMSVPPYVAGTCGIVVSKKMLKVNFARNDVQSGCSVYQHIQDVLKENRAKKTKKNYISLSEDERKSLLLDLRDGSQSFDKMKGVRCFKTAQGKWMSLNMIFKSPLQWTFAVNGSQASDRASERGIALCLSNDIVETLNYQGEKKSFFSWLLKEYFRNSNFKDTYERVQARNLRDRYEPLLRHKEMNYIAFDKSELNQEGGITETLLDKFSSKYLIIPSTKLTKLEKRILRAISEYSYVLQDRKICIGSSGEALAWTDGKTYIALEREWLSNINVFAASGVVQLFTTILHELSHCNKSEGTHIHGYEFYERYYDLSTSYGNILEAIVTFSKRMKKITSEEITADRIARSERKERLAQEKLGIVK